MIKLLTFDQVEKEKAAGQASTDLSARLADLIQDYKGADLESLPTADESGCICSDSPCQLAHAPIMQSLAQALANDRHGDRECSAAVDYFLI